MKLISFSSADLHNSDTIIISLLTPDKVTLQIILIYRPPSTTHQLFLDDLNDLISSLTNKTSTIILGDFNCHINLNSKSSRDLISLMSSHSFHQIVSSRTHTSGNTLDLIFISTENTTTFTLGPINHVISDH